MSDRPLSTVLWDWNVHSYDIDAKLAAAAAGGFDVLTVPYRVYAPWLSSGGNARELLRRAADRGVRLDFLDGMSSWCSLRYPPGNEFIRQALDFSVDDALRLCEELGLQRVVAVPGFDVRQTPSMTQLVDEFGRFCERARGAGLSVDLEFMGMLGIRRLDMAWEIVRQTGLPDVGVMFDTWHFCRGENDIGSLRRLPRGAIRHLQIVDGPREPVGASLWEDVAHRAFPGEGELPLEQLLRVVFDGQDLDTVGPEAMPPDLDDVPPGELGARAARTTAAALRQAETPAAVGS